MCVSPAGHRYTYLLLIATQLGRRIYSLAPHISLIKTAYRALSSQVLTVYPSLGSDARHYVHCRKGRRLHGAVSDKVRDELCCILERCGIRLVAERSGSHRQMLSFRQREGAFLLKTPDLILPGFDG